MSSTSNDGINAIVVTIHDGLKYLHQNCVVLAASVFVLYYLHKTYIVPASGDRGATLSSGRRRTDEQRHQDMMRVRALQQEEVEKKLAETKELRKKQKEQEAKEPKKVLKNEKKTEKKKLRVQDVGAGYNPLQPWSSSAGGGGYKATRRSTRRG